MTVRTRILTFILLISCKAEYERVVMVLNDYMTLFQTTYLLKG